MLVDLGATRLIENRAITSLAAFIERRGSSLRLAPHSKDTDTIINACYSALSIFNPSARKIDFETVWIEKDDFIQIGAIHEGNLIKSYDSKAICDQFHIDNTMAVFTRHKKIYSMRGRHSNIMLDIPNNLQFKEVYYDAKIFHEFITHESRCDNIDISNKSDFNKLMSMVNRTTDIVKDNTPLDINDIDQLNDLINIYGACVRGLRFEDHEVPDKYVISKKWFERAYVMVPKNPFFIFRHVWRCYFRLCKDGYRFNA